MVSTLNIIIAQRLVRKFSGEKEKYNVSADDLANLAKYCNLDRMLELLKSEQLLKPKDTLKDIVFYRPIPSGESKDGYKGRMGLYEVLAVSDTIKDLIVKKSSTKEIKDQAIKEGMRTMFEDGFVKAAQGLTSIEEVLRVIID